MKMKMREKEKKGGGRWVKRRSFYRVGDRRQDALLSVFNRARLNRRAHVRLFVFSSC